MKREWYDEVYDRMYPGKRTIIGEKTMIKGRIRGKEDLILEGKMTGETDLDGCLFVSGSGTMNGESTVREAVVYGGVRGNLKGAVKMTIKKTSSINGDLAGKEILVEDGAVIQGKVELID